MKKITGNARSPPTNASGALSTDRSPNAFEFDRMTKLSKSHHPIETQNE